MFRFRLVPFIAALFVFAVGVALGQWQTRRALEKESIGIKLSQREVAPPLDLNVTWPGIDDAEYRHATIKGEFVSGWPIYLDNRPYKGMAGFYVLMPFRIAGTNHYVLVARGWLKRDPANRSRLPPLVTPSGTIEVEGLVRRNPGHVLQLGPAEVLHPNTIAQNLEVHDLGNASKLNFLPMLLEQSGGGQDGLIRDWPRPSIGAERHRGYAFQWYGLAATALIFFVVTGFRRETK